MSAIGCLKSMNTLEMQSVSTQQHSYPPSLFERFLYLKFKVHNCHCMPQGRWTELRYLLDIPFPHMVSKLQGSRNQSLSKRRYWETRIKEGDILRKGVASNLLKTICKTTPAEHTKAAPWLLESDVLDNSFLGKCCTCQLPKSKSSRNRPLLLLKFWSGRMGLFEGKHRGKFQDDSWEKEMNWDLTSISGFKHPHFEVMTSAYGVFPTQTGAQMLRGCELHK